ncbi:longitudinals lacking protein, isoforms N/O/W/X/Y-like isoform X46 [Aphis craccivora]|uniref:Longitudinals lacking protein, isoforms N/O/W/X/Y-like isoform X46 n=1 Tax=Aphis craccivora TaxID=307492 RepID=A0A6G0ZCG6_APHCR|nr:longitudinals lacking protein, isoforms N/O/W/X/Y-like isoform X46 [Aphis craccivora]
MVFEYSNYSKLSFCHDSFFIKIRYKTIMTQKLKNSTKSTSCDCYTCPQCGKVYKYQSSLNLHLKFRCGVEPKFICQDLSAITNHFDLQLMFTIPNWLKDSFLLFKIYIYYLISYNALP